MLQHQLTTDTDATLAAAVDYRMSSRQFIGCAAEYYQSSYVQYLHPQQAGDKPAEPSATTTIKPPTNAFSMYSTSYMHQ